MYKDYKDDPSIQYKKVLIKQYPSISINMHPYIKDSSDHSLYYIIRFEL